MSKMNLRFRTVIMILVTGIYAGCSSEPKVNELQITSDPQVELERVDQNLKNAQAAQIDVLSPKNFIAAKDSWQNAVKARSENKDQKKILHEISVSQAYLDKAVEVSKVSRQVLSGPIEARRDAQSAKVNKYFLKEMTEADKNLRAVTRRIEENDTASAVAQSEALESKYRDLELKSIKREYLDGPQLAIQQAIKEDAKKLTPQTLTLTEKKYSDDEHLIERNRHNQAIVEKASEDANLAAHRLLKIVRNAKGSKAKNPEELALQNEYNELNGHSTN